MSKKSYLFIVVFFIPFFVFSQQEYITYDQTQNIKFAEQVKDNTEITSYITRDGLKISIGDTLIIGKAVISRNKYLYNDVFSYIVVGKTKGIKHKEFKSLPHNYSGSKVIIKSIFLTHEKINTFKIWPNRKKMPLSVNMFVKNLKGQSSLFSYSRKTILNIEKALSSGEIFNKNAPLSREDAIKKLKESKDLMELDFISKEEYEELRKKLSPIINKSNINKLFVHGNYIMTTYKNVKKNKRGNVLQYKSDFKDILLPILQNNDYLMIKGSNATGLNIISKNLTKGRINVI